MTIQQSIVLGQNSERLEQRFQMVGEVIINYRFRNQLNRESINSAFD